MQETSNNKHSNDEYDKSTGTPYRTTSTPKERQLNMLTPCHSTVSHPDDIMPLEALDSTTSVQRSFQTMTDENAEMLLRYRADNLPTAAADQEPDDAESRVWRLFERVFCFLREMPVYFVRRYLMFTIIVQAVTSTLRIFPIILGLSYQSTLPVFILVRFVFI